MKRFKTKIAIKLPFKKWKDSNEWGDYHMSLALKREFERKGCDVLIQTFSEWYNGDDDDFDVVLVLRGLSRYTPKENHFNIMWNISHPDMVEIEEYNQYDHVFIASKIWAEEISKKASVPVETLLQCTDPELFYHDFAAGLVHELLFVGNSRKVFRKIIKDILPTDKDLAVYGTNWEPFIDEKYILGENIPNNELRRAYSSCKILLNDHWDDMREKGFISNRLFDGFASGAFIISDEVKGASELFGDALVTYNTPEELKNLVDSYLENDPLRIDKALEGEKIVKKYHTYSNRVDEMLKVIKLNTSPKLHFPNSDLRPEVFMDRLWNTVISPIINNLQVKDMVLVGQELTLIKNILVYCQQELAHLNLITQSINKDLESYKNEYSNYLDILKETSFISLPKLQNYGAIFLDGNKDLHTIHSELAIIEKGFENKDFPLIFLYNINAPDCTKFSTKKSDNILLNKNQVKYSGNDPDEPSEFDENYTKEHHYHLINAVEEFINESESDLSYAITDAYNGLMIISSQDEAKDQIIDNTINSIGLLQTLEDERQKFSVAYIESKSLINTLETKLLETKIDLEIEEDNINLQKLKLKQTKTRLESQIAISEQLNKEKETLVQNINERKNQFRILAEQFDRISENLLEMKYYSGNNRPLTQRIISRTPSLYILLSRRNTSIKNALLNIKAYKAIKNSNVFDIGYYLNNYDDVRRSGKDPIMHYLYEGFKEGRKPNPSFDTEYYMERHADVRNSNLNPLAHYVLYGIHDGRKTQEKNGKDAFTQLRMKDKKSVLKGSKHHKNVRGSIFTPGDDPVIRGWLAKIGDNNPRTAILKIDNKDEYEVICDIFRSDLKKNKINQGKHAFEFPVPTEYINKKNHNLVLIDKKTGKILTEMILNWSQNRFFKEFGGFLVDSILTPTIRAPFREEDKRCFGVMENVANHLSDLSMNMDDKPLISVVMPVLNRIDTIQAAVDSVLEQTYPNFELVIVDDGSEDGTFELLKGISDERIILLRNDSCQGVSNARNRALAVARGKYIAYLDSDNLWDPKYLAAMIGAFLKLPDADAIYSGQLLFRANNESPIGVRFASYNKSLLKNTNYIDMNAFCHTQDVYKRLGGFDESLKRLVDYDLIMRISEDAKIYSIPVLLSYYYFDKTENAISKTVNYDESLELTRNKQQLRTETRLLAMPSKVLERNVSVVIPSFESMDDIRNCIKSILDLDLGDLLEIIVVDNASSQPVVDYLLSLESDGKIKLLLNTINYGFTYAVNQGINLAESDNDILILNNDAQVTHGAIEALQSGAYNLKNCGITVPQQVLPGGTKTISLHVPAAKSQFDCDVNLSAHHANIKEVPIFHNGEVLELNFAPFFCVYIKREVLENSTGLDAEYGRHYRSDRIFCDYIQHLMGLKIYYISEAVVIHKLQKSTEVLSQEPDSTFNVMFRKNQWEPELAKELGYKTPKWDQ